MATAASPALLGRSRRRQSAFRLVAVGPTSGTAVRAPTRRSRRGSVHEVNVAAASDCVRQSSATIEDRGLRHGRARQPARQLSTGNGAMRLYRRPCGQDRRSARPSACPTGTAPRRSAERGPRCMGSRPLGGGARGGRRGPQRDGAFGGYADAFGRRRRPIGGDLASSRPVAQLAPRRSASPSRCPDLMVADCHPTMSPGRSSGRASVAHPKRTVIGRRHVGDCCGLVMSPRWSALEWSMGVGPIRRRAARAAGIAAACCAVTGSRRAPPRGLIRSRGASVAVRRDTGPSRSYPLIFRSARGGRRLCIPEARRDLLGSATKTAARPGRVPATRHLGRTRHDVDAVRPPAAPRPPDLPERARRVHRLVD